MMNLLRVYMDNCCFNRPYDDQSQLKIKNETDAIRFIQERIKRGEVDLAWSFILDYENILNPFIERKNAIKKWKQKSKIDIVQNENFCKLQKK